MARTTSTVYNPRPPAEILIDITGRSPSGNLRILFGFLFNQRQHSGYPRTGWVLLCSLQGLQGLPGKSIGHHVLFPATVVYSFGSLNLLCVSTAPNPMSLSFVWSVKRSPKSGETNTGGSVRFVINASNAIAHRRPFFNNADMGCTNEAKFGTIRQYQEAMPKHIRSYLTVLGGFSLIAAILLGSV